MWELDEEDAVFALLAGNIKAKGLKPLTINEVKIQPDWPKWEDTVNTKLKKALTTHIPGMWLNIPRHQHCELQVGLQD